MHHPSKVDGVENNYFTEMCSESEAGSYLRLINFVYHSALGLRVRKKKEEEGVGGCPPDKELYVSLSRGIEELNTGIGNMRQGNRGNHKWA